MRGTDIECGIIDWRITSTCNNCCEYCYASTSLLEMNDAERKIVLDNIILSGCKTVCISGGEPLMSANALAIIKYLHNCGISIFLSTNGSQYMKYREELEKYISKLSLPLDGYDIESNGINGRYLKGVNDSKEESFSSVKNILDYYQTHTHNFAIKIGTVLTKKNVNIGHFEKMFDFLKQYSIDLWKVYEFIPEGRGLINYNNLSLTKDEMDQFKQEFDLFHKKVVEHGKFDCTLLSRDMRDSAYFIVQPDGTVMIPIDDKENGVREEVIGDLKIQSINEVLRLWNNKINSIRYNANFLTRNLSRTLAKKYIENIDKEIIYILDKDPLQEVSQIAEKLETHGEVSINEIEIRIDKLYSIRAIRHVMPVINVAQFGLEVFLINLFFKQSLSMDSAEIAEILCHDPYIAWVAECYEYNSNEEYVIFRIAILIENNNKLYERIKYLRGLFGEALYRYEIDIVPDKYICGQGFLLERPDTYGIRHDHITLNANRVKLTQNEYRVIAAMTSSERLTLDTIVKATSLEKKKVSKIIDGLLSKAVINKFQVVLDTNVLGYQCYLLFIKFNTCENKDEFEEYVKNLPNVTHINTLNAGRWDIDVEIHVEQSSMCAAIWTDLENRFGDNMLEKKLVSIKKDHKFKFLIDVTLKAIEESVHNSFWPFRR